MSDVINTTDEAPVGVTEDVGTIDPPVPAVSPKRLSYDASTAVEKYVQLRDKVAAIKEGHKAELLKYNAAMEMLEGHLFSILEDAGSTSMKTPAGTAYKSTLTSANVTEWHKTLDWIREHDTWELLEARVNKTAVEEIVRTTGSVPPGVKITQRININIRRA